MQFTAEQIAGLVKGIVEGNAEASVNQLSKIEEGTPNTLSFLSNPQYTPYLYTTDASIVIVAKDLVLEKELKKTCTLIRVDDPRKSFATLLETYNQIKNNKSGIEQPNFIAKTATLADNTYIGAFSYIGEGVKIGKNTKIYPNAFIADGCKIGDNTTIYSGVKIYADCVVGNNCTIHAGVVIGGDGFGFAPNSENNYHKIPHIGNVVLEDYVEIGSNSTIDRATLGSTIIRKGVKLDNLIQIAHNVEIGENTVIAAQTGVAGSTKIGKNCMIGGQVGIVGHLTIANNVKIAAQSGIGHSITQEGEIVQGSPAFGIGDYKRSYVLFRKLPSIQEKITELEKQLKKSTNNH
ncbi:MAG: UDP-3-O-(3-hydroxymyristoyl)glucosamine N-acyltransferase [Bacteroidetes bacterium]|nr:UDP-3-O-(3-hydroxymyristoyl)glucosamine N-acyltransferase [Bacteroidota bacterium]